MYFVCLYVCFVSDSVCDYGVVCQPSTATPHCDVGVGGSVSVFGGDGTSLVLRVYVAVIGGGLGFVGGQTAIVSGYGFASGTGAT